MRSADLTASSNFLKNWHIYYPPIRAASYLSIKTSGDSRDSVERVNAEKTRRNTTGGGVTKRAADVAALDAARTEARGVSVGRYDACDAGHVSLAYGLAVT